MRSIAFNSQRDNFDFAHKFAAFSQCMSTSVWMFLCFYISQLTATDDRALADFISQVEIQVNPLARIALDAMHRWNWIHGFSSQWWLTQKEAIEDYFRLYGIQKSVVYRESQAAGLGLSPGSFPDLLVALKSGPVVAATMNLAGLPGGHIILINDCQDGMFSCNDPFGDASTGYKRTEGKDVRYSPTLLIPAMQRATGRAGELRYMYAV